MRGLFLVAIFLISHTVVAQFEEQQIISTTTASPYIAQPYDIDNDGAMDVLVAFGENLSLSWFRNTDGLGTFSEEILINSNPVLYLSIHFTDIDTDGDQDILFIGNNPRRLVWLENTDGEGTFATEQEIAEEDYIDSVVPMDFDNDGDIDLISSYTDTFTDTIRWYENIDGSGVFSEPELLFDNLSRLSELVIADINNDTFEDLLTSHENEGPATIVWYQNTGNTSFLDASVLHQYDFFTNPSLSDQTSVYELQFEDINNDDSKDVIFIAELDFPEFYYRKLSWLENLDNTGNFGALVDIFEDTFDVYRFFDIDDDGDNDIIKYFRNFDQISWIEYDQNLAAFTTERVITTEVDFLRNVQAADFNNDGLLDIVSASSGDEKVAWYENTGILSVDDTKLSQYTITPNPVNNLLTITGEKDISFVKLYSLTGQELIIEIENNTINVSHLPAGYYFLNVQNTALYAKTISFIKR